MKERTSAEQPVWNSARGTIPCSAPYGIMGIVNLTPDSFYAQSRSQDPDEALRRSLAMLENGADVIDLGAESSRPGAAPVSPQIEIERLLPLIGKIRKAAPSAVISVDTYHAATAAAVLEEGADIINDISACSFDPELLDVVAEYKPGYVLMHCQGTPGTMQLNPSYADVCCEVAIFFETMMNRLVSRGLPEENIILDPGIGFGKTMEHNLALMRGTKPWEHLGRPSLMACSMKSVFGDLLGLPTEERGTATLVATALIHAAGYRWHRVHNPLEARQSLCLVQALLRG